MVTAQSFTVTWFSRRMRVAWPPFAGLAAAWPVGLPHLPPVRDDDPWAAVPHSKVAEARDGRGVGRGGLRGQQGPRLLSGTGRRLRLPGWRRGHPAARDGNRRDRRCVPGGTRKRRRGVPGEPAG